MKKHFTCANAALPTPPCNSHRTGTILSLALTLMLGWSANSWADVPMPAGTYYFDFSQCSNAQIIKVFDGINQDSRIGFDATNDCNKSTTKNNNKEYVNTAGFSVLVLTLNEQDKANNLYQLRIGSSTWPNWQSATTPTNVGNNTYICQIHSDYTYSWAPEGTPIPSCDTPTPTDPCPNCKKITK